jgi:hypothetical protein
VVKVCTYNTSSVENNVRIKWKYDDSIDGSCEARDFYYGGLRGAFATILLSSKTVGAKDYKFVSPSISFADSTGTPKTYMAGTISLSFKKDDHESIDCVIKTTKHELQHTKRFYQNKLLGYSLVDSDSDWLPDTVEDSLGTCWNKAVTYPSGTPLNDPDYFYLDGDDDEIECEIEATKPHIKSKVDWAFPGEQWH